MTILLFGSRLSPFVEKVVRALHRKGLEFTLVPPFSPRDFSRWNPQTGKMPVLDIDGERIFDSTVILRRLDQLRPTPPLFDASPAIAARQRFLEDWSDEALYWYGMGLRWSSVNADATAAQVLGDVGVPPVFHWMLVPLLRRRIGGQAVAQGLQRLPMTLLVTELASRLDELKVWLGDNPFFFSDEPGAADFAILGQLLMLQSGPTPQAAELIAGHAWLREYIARVDAASSEGHTAG